MLTSSMLTGEGAVKFAKILLTSYVNAPKQDTYRYARAKVSFIQDDKYLVSNTRWGTNNKLSDDKPLSKVTYSYRYRSGNNNAGAMFLGWKKRFKPDTFSTFKSLILPQKYIEKIS